MASAPPKVPQMPRLDDFIDATTVRVGGKLGFAKLGPVLSRDRLVEVDIALDAWWKGSDADRRFHTLYLMEACSKWSARHLTNQGATRTGAQRMIAIDNLAKQCRRWIAFDLAFKGIGEMKSLDQKYAAERSHYKTSKDQGSRINPIGGSFVHADGYEAMLNKPMTAMTARDYEWIAERMGVDMRKGRTKYMNKAERNNHILEVRGGTLKTLDDKEIASTMMYAMSKYGTVHAKDALTAANMWRTADAETEFFNHSSFMSGKDVICAGTIEKVDINYGQPKLVGMIAITTLSGHYKPAAENLANCLKALQISGFDTSKHVAFAAAFNGENIDYGRSIIMKADDFLRHHG